MKAAHPRRSCRRAKARAGLFVLTARAWMGGKVILSGGPSKMARLLRKPAAECPPHSCCRPRTILTFGLRSRPRWWNRPTTRAWAYGASVTHLRPTSGATKGNYIVDKPARIRLELKHGTRARHASRGNHLLFESGKLPELSSGAPVAEWRYVPTLREPEYSLPGEVQSMAMQAGPRLSAVHPKDWNTHGRFSHRAGQVAYRHVAGCELRERREHLRNRAGPRHHSKVRMVYGSPDSMHVGLKFHR
jgi:hypothetical protein